MDGVYQTLLGPLCVLEDTALPLSQRATVGPDPPRRPGQVPKPGTA